MQGIQLGRVLESFPESIYWKDRNSVYLGCSHALAQWAGCASSEDIVGKTDHDLSWSKLADTFIAHDRLVMNEQRLDVLEEAQPIASGDWILVRTIKGPFYDENGELAGVIGLSMDVTQFGDSREKLIKKLAIDSAIKKAESDFLNSWYSEVTGQKVNVNLSPETVGNKLKFFVDNIIDKLPANIFWMSRDGRLLGCNSAMANVCGFQQTSELVGRNIIDFLTPDTINLIKDNNRQVFDENKTITVEEYPTDAHGRSMGIFLTHKAPLLDLDGQTIGLMGVSFDITERKQMEADLVIAKEQAEAANCAKTNFLNNMRHDLRTPLSCVLGSARILRQMETCPEKNEFIDGIINQSESLLQMLTNMLEFDAVQAKERAVQLGDVEIVKLLHDVASMLSLVAKKKGLQLALNIEPKLPRKIISDGYRLQRILLNVMGNAIKFTAKGHVSVSLAMEGKRAIAIEVEDTGIGIAPEKHDLIFGRFVRVMDANKGLYDGEGLGLSIVKQFCDDLNASISIKSALGEGTLFRLVVPVEVIKESVDESITG